jgi:hypothetical protein
MGSACSALNFFTAQELDAQSSELKLLLRCTLITPTGQEEPDGKDINLGVILLNISMRESALREQMRLLTDKCLSIEGSIRMGDWEIE